MWIPKSEERLHIKDTEDGRGSNSNAHSKQELNNKLSCEESIKIKLWESRSYNILSKQKEV